MNLDPAKLTFSQAHGFEGLPTPLELNQIPSEARLRIWDGLFVGAIQHTESDYFEFAQSSSEDSRRWFAIFAHLHSYWLLRPIDDFDWAGSVVIDYKDAVLHELEFNKLFDLLQMIMRHEECPDDFTNNMARIFRSCNLAYVIEKSQPVTIVPARTQLEGEAIKAAISMMNENGLDGANEHLRLSCECINQSEWAGAVRESVHAVESIARQLAGSSVRTLAAAIDSLDAEDELHPAFKKAVKALYGYTSDEKGIRHPLLEKRESAVSVEEAVFMLSACASLCSFLWNRYSN